VFSREIQTSSGTVLEFINRYSPDVHLVGRIFFHLVENRSGDQPFAFLATYSTALNKQGQSRHLPMKHVLQEYGTDSGKFLELMDTVHLTAQRSALLTELVDTGELFHPLAWSAREAFLFLREIPIHEQSGVLCRIPDWWEGNAVAQSLAQGR